MKRIFGMTLPKVKTRSGLNRTLFLITAMLMSLAGHAQEQVLTKEILHQMADTLHAIGLRDASTGRISIDSTAFADGKLTIYCNDNAANIPFRKANVEEVYDAFRGLLPQDLKRARLTVVTAGQAIENLIPVAEGGKRDKTFRTTGRFPLVSYPNRPFRPSKGLYGRHIAMWQSHGKYYEQKLQRWEWQRARIFETVEDLYTQSYVLPFLVPMLERAGAYVMMPRERDANPYEIIVDNDPVLAKSEEDADNYTFINIQSAQRSHFSATNGDEVWSRADSQGFAYNKAQLLAGDNPFTEGSALKCTTIKKGKESKAVWQPCIPKTGEYAVYVSYQTLPTSTHAARYTIRYNGGQTVVTVNQQMGGGTWIYLGTFPFREGLNPDEAVELSNVTDHAGDIVTADAVKIGGGMGNVARSLSPGQQEENSRHGIFNLPPQISTYPRFCEGARYWMQWAGVPDSIYNLTDNKNDYSDDYKNRGLWVNWLAGGSEVLPEEKGLNVPLDLSFAFHSDAGTTLNDNIVGTLAIYDTKHYDGRFTGDVPRTINRQLADLVQTSIVEDIRKAYEPRWNRRQMWDKSYFEAWQPRVPAMLLELLSHQNFADMRYGLDPRFRFLVSRAIYKGILRFISSERGEKAVVAPLPVHRMALKALNRGEVELTWLSTTDTLEPTAVSKQYIVYTRIDSAGWDEGMLVKKPLYRTKLSPNHIYSFKVEAVNDGGRSFPSEILSAGLSAGYHEGSQANLALVINGFNRVSAPADFVAPGEASTQLAGFLDEVDHGVPYLKDISYIGRQKEFRRNIPWMDDDAAGFGDSYGDEEKNIIAGNTFDYTYTHGSALLSAGRSFVSCSREAVEDSSVDLSSYVFVDLILGKQCQTKMGRGGTAPLEFKTFTPSLELQLTKYLNLGGRLMVSGAYVGSDLWDNPLRIPESQLDREELRKDQAFAQKVLKYKWRTGQAATGGNVYWTMPQPGSHPRSFNYYNRLNAESYVVESPDAIEPADTTAQTVMRYGENNLSAAVAHIGKDYATFVMGVPFEAIRETGRRNALMQQILHLLNLPKEQK